MKTKKLKLTSLSKGKMKVIKAGAGSDGTSDSEGNICSSCGTCDSISTRGYGEVTKP